MTHDVSFRTDGFRPVLTDLRILLHLPLPVEMMAPERAYIGVGLMITTAIQAFECVRAGFAFLHF